MSGIASWSAATRRDTRTASDMLYASSCWLEATPCQASSVDNAITWLDWASRSSAAWAFSLSSIENALCQMAWTGGIRGTAGNLVLKPLAWR
ncbi:hypothetical protein ACFJIX_21000 [Roseateles sp. UC29_93]|uniref:hypothetical protein n=1 Tax=Roseateles sp. UC29_93 TaxID=3350177 RepID=UPI00366D7CE0